MRACASYGLCVRAARVSFFWKCVRKVMGAEQDVIAMGFLHLRQRRNTSPGYPVVISCKMQLPLTAVACSRKNSLLSFYSERSIRRIRRRAVANALKYARLQGKYLSQKNDLNIWIFAALNIHVLSSPFYRMYHVCNIWCLDTDLLHVLYLLLIIELACTKIIWASHLCLLGSCLAFLFPACCCESPWCVFVAYNTYACILCFILARLVVFSSNFFWMYTEANEIMWE